MSGLLQAATETLLPIAVVDVRDGGPVQHAREGALRAQALRDDCLAWFPAIAAPALPLMDSLARRWLTRSGMHHTGARGGRGALACPYA